jgi:hypothetical protein
MPRYRLRTSSITGSARQRAVEIAARRFPEIEIEEPGADDDRDDWVCRAPSIDHIRRWARAAELELAEDQPPPSEQVDPTPQSPISHP